MMASIRSLLGSPRISAKSLAEEKAAELELVDPTAWRSPRSACASASVELCASARAAAARARGGIELGDAPETSAEGMMRRDRWSRRAGAFSRDRQSRRQPCA